MSVADPTNKYFLRSRLFSKVYLKVVTEETKKIQRIIEQNAYLDRFGQMAFMYKGQEYCAENYRPQRRLGLLHRDLYPAMEEWLEEGRELQKEKETVLNYLSCLLIRANSAEELKTITPECLHSELPEYWGVHNHVPMTQEEIDAFNKQNEEAIHLIKKRLLLNMIT